MRVPASCEIPTKSTTRAAAKRTRRAKGVWTARRDIPSDARRMRLPRMGRHGMYAHLTRGQRARLTRRRARQQEHLARKRGAARSRVWRTHKTAAPPRTNGNSARTASTAPYKARAVREPRAPPHPTRKRSKRSNGAPRNGKICAPCMIRGARAAKSAPSWQDLRAVYSRKAICRAFRIHGARILPKSAHFGCMAAICCQEGALFPSEAPFGIHEAQNLPRIAARERTRAKYCHRQAPENAPWRHGGGRCRANGTSANSTPRAGTSKKP